jgi:hypothetical protein
MLYTLRQLLTLSLILIGSFSYAQPGGVNYVKDLKPPINRQLRHEFVDREQANALRIDGKADQQFTASPNDDVNFLVTKALTQKVDYLQYKIEKDSTAHNEKLKYLRGLENILRGFTAGFKNRSFAAGNLPILLDVFEKAMDKDRSKQSIEDLVEKSSYPVSYLLLSSGAFDANSGYRASRNLLMLKYSLLHPENIFVALRENPDVPFRDSLIKVAGYKYPRKLYDYAAAGNRLGAAIRNVDDPFIRTVSRMASSNSGQLYFAFLDNIIKGKLSLADIDAVKGDDVKYYKLLVRTRIDYATRRAQGDTVLEMKALEDMVIRKAKDVFVKEINALHESPDAVRFKILNQLNAQELYYVAVSSEDEIYTSSFTKGVYPLMMQKIGNRGDSLLMSVGFDRFKKFIKMAAGYNTLGNFLGTFPTKDSTAQLLMRAFVNRLETSQGLEDGVDVADSYASIAETLKPIAAEMLVNVKANYDRSVAENNRRGTVIYDLLYKLFLSADSTNKIDLSKEFGIPPVYNVNYKSLINDSGKVIMQVFFYGDKDGRANYANFLPAFRNASWKITETPQWVMITSTKGKPVWIFANKPLSEEEGKDDEAQKALNEYLGKKGLQPSIVVHRGHSYYAPTTISYIQPAAKIVYLGSCGGYHLLHDVLKNAPDAHIISSKQIGKMAINQPFFDLLIENVRQGNDIEWIPFWKKFGSMIKDKDGLDDYIPPYKNLGAIFIKAYKTAMGENSDDE